MRFILVSISILLVTITSCKKDVKDNINDEFGIDKPYLNFSLKSVNASFMKGTPQKDLAEYNSVSVQIYSYDDTENFSSSNLPSSLALYGDITLNKAGLGWEYTPPKYWPEGRNTAFFAYASDIDFGKAGITITPEDKINIPTITYTVPQDVKDQPDLLVATPLVDMTKANNGGYNRIRLDMNHALACISFAPVSTLSRKIESITIKGVYSTADLKLSDIQTGVNESTDIKWIGHRNKDITFSAGIKDGVDIPQQLPTDLAYLMSKEGYLMMVPQKIEPGAKIVVKYSDRTDVVELDIPEREWKAGKKYIYSWGSGGVVTYYEIYADDNSVGLYYYDVNGTLKNTIRQSTVDNANIKEAGYGVFYGGTSLGKIKIKWPGYPIQAAFESEFTEVSAMQEISVVIGGRDHFLYPISQTSITGGGSQGPFVLSPSNTPVAIYFNDEIAHGYCLPHFAKGVYLTNVNVDKHYIRTPQQMINISVNTYDHDYNYTSGCKFYQEHDLDFGSGYETIGGKSTYSSAIIGYPTTNDEFKYYGSGCFNGEYWAEGASIKNLKIKSPDAQIGLFRYVGTWSVIRLLTIESSCSIEAIGEFTDLSSAVGGLVGLNTGKLRANNNYANVIAIGRRNVGGICGYMTQPGSSDIMGCHNYGNITGKFTVGGILGACDATAYDNPNAWLYIEDCTTNGGTVKCEERDSGAPDGVGGICGMIPVYGTSVRIKNCANNGTNVESKSAAGGILGFASIAKASTNGSTGGSILFESCAVYNASVVGSGDGYDAGIGGVIGSASLTSNASGEIILEDILYVNSKNDCQVLSTCAIDGVNPSNVHVGGILGYSFHNALDVNATVRIRDCVYIGVAPIGVYSGRNYLYPIIGDDTGSTFEGKYYYLKSTAKSYNNINTRFELAKGYTTAEFASDMELIYKGLSPINIFLNTSFWESVYNNSSKYPYPKLNAISTPTSWPVVNDAKQIFR